MSSRTVAPGSHRTARLRSLVPALHGRHTARLPHQGMRLTRDLQAAQLPLDANLKTGVQKTGSRASGLEKP